MSRENAMQAVDNLLRNYGKDREWLAVLLGYEPEKFNKILSNDKTTYGQLQNMLQRGGIQLRITIQGEIEPDEGAGRLQFLKNNIRMHRNRSEYIRKVMKRSNIPETWYEQDDIPMSELVAMEKNFKFKLLYHFKGLNACNEDVMKTEPLKKTASVNNVSPYVVKNYEFRLNWAKKNGIDIGADTREDTADGTFKNPDENKTETVPAFVRTKTLKFEKQQYEQISVRAFNEGKSIIDFITQVLEDTDLVENANYVKKDLTKEGFTYKSLPKLTNEVHRTLNDMVSITELSKENVIWCIFDGVLNKKDSPEPEVRDPEPEPVPESSAQTEEEPVQASVPEREKTSEKKTKDEPAHGGKTFMNWMKALNADEKDLLADEFRLAGKEELTDGRYGVDTVNAIKPFRYPEDAQLIRLSAKLKTDVKAGRLLFVTTEEGDWQTRSLIMKNQTMTEQYILYNEVICRLAACYTSESVAVKEEVLTTDNVPVTSFSIVKKGEEPARLVFTTERKRFLSTRKESFTALPGMLHPVQWYQLADLAEKHFLANNKLRIQETIANCAGAVREKKRTFERVLVKSIAEVILETSGSGLTDGFLFQNTDGTLWSEPAVRNGKAVFRHMTDSGEETAEAETIPSETLDRLFNAVLDHICKQLTTN